MKIEKDVHPRSHTLDKGTYVFVDPLGGGLSQGLWSGEQLRPVRRAVFITIRSLRYTDELDALLRYDVPGIAPVLFIGSPDGYKKPRRDIDNGWLVAVVEARPQGVPLGEAVPLNPAEVVRLGLGLCDTIQAWSERAVITEGLRPETVYVTGGQGQRRFAGATPRAFFLIGSQSPYTTAFSYDLYEPPAANAWIEIALDDELFTVAMILWFALLGEHPYDSRRQDHDIWNDIRRPFTGPPELGRLLEAVLVADVEKRMKTDELRSELARLARAWNVDLPPFPPPGLASS